MFDAHRSVKNTTHVHFDLSKASGISAVIKTILMLQNNKIPPHAGIKSRINSKFPPLDTLNVHIAKRATEFKIRTSASKRRIIVNSFGAAVSFPMTLFDRFS